MMMQKDEIVQNALENLYENTAIMGRWESFCTGKPDGRIEFTWNNQHFGVNVIVVNSLRNHHIPGLLNQAELQAPMMIVGTHFFPKIKEELRQNNIGYLEANGNIYYQREGIMLWLDSHKPVGEKVEKGNRAFSKTGLKVVFQFLKDNNLINMSYRDIAGSSGVALGNINYVMTGLKETGFLVKQNKDQSILLNKQMLLEKWIRAYAERLRPALSMGTFRFMNADDADQWRDVALDYSLTQWGGEPAADLLTDYLRPAEFIIYTSEARNELIKNYKLIPDEKGNVKIFKKFWANENGDQNQLVVPAILVYADLIINDDKRCRETAQLIYDKYIEPNL